MGLEIGELGSDAGGEYSDLTGWRLSEKEVNIVLMLGVVGAVELELELLKVVERESEETR